MRSPTKSFNGSCDWEAPSSEHSSIILELQNDSARRELSEMKKVFHTVDFYLLLKVLMTLIFYKLTKMLNFSCRS